jgi:hypothetical protein
MKSVQNLAVAVQPANPGVTSGDEQAAFAATVTLTAGDRSTDGGSAVAPRDVELR